MAKNSYEEQRAAELVYAEEYRRRLRRSRSANTDNAEREARLAEERAVAEAERAATVERQRSEAEERRRRTEELIARARVVSDPARDLVTDMDEWSPLVDTTSGKDTERVDSGESHTTPTSSAPVSHNLHIEGMSFAGASAVFGAPDTSVASRPTSPTSTQSTEGRVYGRGVVYSGYGFDDEPVSDTRSDETGFSVDTHTDIPTNETVEAPTITRSSMEAKTRTPSDEPPVSILRSNMEDKTRPMVDDISEVPESVPTIKRKTFEEKVRPEVTESEIDDEYDGDDSGSLMDDSHLIEEDYRVFLSREKSGGVSRKTDPRDEYKPDYTAPEMTADEPEAREDPISKMDDEEAALAFAGYYHEADKRAREGERAGSIKGYTPEYSLDEKTKLDIEKGDSPIERTKRDEEIDERELRREMEQDMLEFVRREERAKKTGRTSMVDTFSGDADPAPDIPPYDKKALIRMKKNECKNDIAMIEARIGSEISRIEAERDKLEFTFGETDKRDKREDKRNEKAINSLKAKLKRARAFEIADNDRYYQAVLLDLARARVPDKANMSRVIELRERLMELLRRRDELNTRLTELYLGKTDKNKGGLEARAAEARKARRKEFRKRSSLAGRIKREKVGYDYREKLYRLMNDEVRIAGDIAECRYILRREKPKGEAQKVIKKRLTELEREYKKNDKEIDRVAKAAFKKAKDNKEKKKGEVAGWIGLIILLAIVGVIIWQWDAISAFIAENVTNFGTLVPDGDVKPDSDVTPGDGEVTPEDGDAENPMDEEGSGTSGNTPSDSDGTTDESDTPEVALLFPDGMIEFGGAL